MERFKHSRRQEDTTASLFKSYKPQDNNEN